MDLDTNITSSCRISVLLVPIYPIKRSVFTRYVQLVRQFTIIRLNDVTPDNKADHAAFTSHNFEQGQIHFEFSTHYSGDHQDLDDFQPHRRLFGVIGIMDCQEWQDQDLKTGYQQFIDSLHKYPSPIVTRCFGFDPTETQPDDTKGLIMIPDVGDTAFYMATLISDFASQILTQFSVLAKNIGQELRSDSGRNTNYASPLLASQSFDDSRHGVSANVGYASRARKRAPGRIKKLYADFYLLSGRLPDAISLYLQAIDMTKITSDYLWLASAIEGYVCTILLLEQLQGNQESRNLTARWKPGHSYYTTTESSPGKDDPSTTESPLTVPFVLEQYNAVLHYYAKEFDNKTTATYKSMDDVPNNDNGGFVANMTGSVTISSLVYAEACLKMARFLLTVYLNGKLDDNALFLLMHGATTSSLAPTPSSPSPSLPATPISMTHPQQLAIPDECGVERWDIGLWTTRVWETSVSKLAVIDQIHLMAQMTFIYSSIGYHRKAAWMKYQSINLMLPILLHRRAKSALATKQSKSLPVLESQGILSVLKWVCKVYGIEDAIQDNDPILKVDTTKLGTINRFPGAATTTGWPALQIAVLRKCIITAESLHAYNDMLHYTSLLLKNLYPYILKEEQIRLAKSIQRVSAIQQRSTMTKDIDLKDSSPNYWGVNIITSITATQPIPRKQLHQHPLGKTLILSAISGTPFQENEPSSTDSTDPFIYNPFTQKKEYVKEQILLIQDEVAEFQVSLTNPFGFDLELQNIRLCTSGVSFQVAHHSAIVPAYETTHLRLAGVPQEPGILSIKGCFIKIVGFAEQEFLVGENKSDDQDPSLINPYEFIVVRQKPLVKIKSTSLIQSAIMLFEGERTQIKLELENIGNVPVDFIAVTFMDNGLVSSGSFLSMEQQYELERMHTKVFGWQGNIKHKDQTIGDRVWLTPDSTLDITLDIYGQHGSTHGTIQVDYGYLDDENKTDIFYTRQLYMPILITVYCHLKPQNWDILSVQLEDMARSDIEKGDQLQAEKILGRMADTAGNLQDQYCLATIDIQNRWSLPFKVVFTIENASLMDTLIPPGTTSRMILPIQRFMLSDNETSLPITLDSRKQFVVAPPALADQETSNKWQLVLFWYRESLLRRIKAAWISDDDTRQGDLDLRACLRLTMTQLPILKLPDMVFDVSLQGTGVTRLGLRHFSCQVDQSVTMILRLTNQHLERSTKFILRVQPKETGLQHKVLMEGMNQVILPEVPLHEQAQHTIPIYFMAQGRYDFIYHAQDMITKITYYDQKGITVDVIM